MHSHDAEAGIRHKFEPVQRDSYVSGYRQLEELSYWCAVFDREGLTPVEGGASAGNLSFRTTRGFVITPTRSQLKEGLAEQDFLEVVRVEINGDQLRVHFLGGKEPLDSGGRIPSSDVPMHHLIYAARPDVAAVLHGHDPVVLQQASRLDVPMTQEETTFGTIEDARATVRDLGDNYYLVRRGHGFVSVGRNLADAGQRALGVHRQALALGQ